MLHGRQKSVILNFCTDAKAAVDLAIKRAMENVGKNLKPQYNKEDGYTAK